MDKPEPKPRPLWAVADAPSGDVGADAHGHLGIAAELVQRACTGDMQAWSRLYQDHFDGLYRHLRYLTGDAQVSEELVQETFVKALECIGNYDARARFSTWLHGIGLNIVRHHWRAQRSTAKAHAKLCVLEELRESGQATTPDKTVLARQRVRVLYDALDELPIHLREAFILRELEGLALDEAAAQLGITTNNLAVRTSRARTRIRRMLEAAR